MESGGSGQETPSNQHAAGLIAMIVTSVLALIVLAMITVHLNKPIPLYPDTMANCDGDRKHDCPEVQRAAKAAQAHGGSFIWFSPQHKCNCS